MRRCILATVRDVITDHVACGCCDGCQTFNRPTNALVLHVQPHLKELEQSSKAFPLKNTEKRPMGYVGISGLAKTVTLKPRKKPLSGRYTKHRRCRDIGEMAFAIMAQSTGIQVNCNVAT